MPIRRSALSALCLVVFGTAALPAQQADPFAEWDRQSKRPAAKSAAKAPKAAVTYFSPEADTGSDSAAQAGEDNTKSSAMKVVQTKMRERNATVPATKKPDARKPDAGKQATVPAGPKSDGMVIESLNGTAPHKDIDQRASGNAATKHKSNAVGRKPGQPVVLSNKTAAVSNAPVTAPAEEESFLETAALQSKEDTSAKNVIRQVSQSEEEMSEPSEDVNPFEDFLNAEEGAAPAEVAASHSEPEAFGEESEHAEALFPPAAEKAKAASSASDAEEKLVPARKPGVSTPAVKNSIAPVSVTKKMPSTSQAEAADASPSADAGPQSPGVTVQWVRRGDFNVGQECDVDLIVENTSKAMVRGVTTEAVIPASVEMLESNPPVESGTDSPSWTFGELKPGEIRTVSMKMIPRGRGGVRLDAVVRLTGSSSAEFSVQEPMLAVEVSGAETVEVGEQVGFVVRVTNPGTGLASNVIIQAAVPEGLEHRSGRILSIEIGTLNPGESRQAKLSLSAVKGGDYKLAVRAIADGELTDETVAALVIAEPQLNIAISGPQEQMTGRTTDFTMTVSNAGNVQSANVRAKYRIPEGLEFVSADRGGKYNKVDHSIEWFVGTLQPDETSDFQLTLKATQTGELTHQAGVISEHGQVTLCDYATTVEGMAALNLEIVASDKSLTKGEKVTWEVHIRNTGTSPAVNVGMSCELPSGIELIHADGPTQHLAENGIMVFRSLPVIPPSEEVVYTIEANCIRTGNHRLRMRVASESIAEPLIGEEAATVTDR